MSPRIYERKTISAKYMASRSGYRDIHVFLVRSFDFVFALLLLIPAVCILSIYFILYKIFNKQSGSFFYRGERLGINKKIFQIYKIRTLSLEDEKNYYSEIFLYGNNSELKFGRFLRWTRLDELPQLFNIIKGDMSFLGPRPLRNTIYLKNREHIPNYERRFLVKPGLIGYAQLLTPHSAPKRIRSLIDNHYVAISRNPFWDILFIIWSIVVLCKNFMVEFFCTINDVVFVIRNNSNLRNRRRMRRVKGKGIKAYITDDAFNKMPQKDIQVVDINNEALCIMTDLDLDVDEKLNLGLETVIGKKKKVKRKKAKCGSVVFRKKENAPGSNYKWSYILMWVPVSALNLYKIEQYILRQSIAKPW
jgi:lipopolysaccharide/colanic/teichoic acid biosynthesis glycosyltransferase